MGPLTSVNFSFSEPNNPIYGDMYFNNSSQKMFIYNKDSWDELIIYRPIWPALEKEKERIKKLNKIFKVYG